MIIFKNISDSLIPFLANDIELRRLIFLIVVLFFPIYSYCIPTAGEKNADSKPLSAARKPVEKFQFQLTIVHNGPFGYADILGKSAPVCSDRIISFL